MGANPLGSNKKSRTTLIFNRNIERTEFKNAISDVATVRNASPSETVRAVLLEHVAVTPEARNIARTMYAADSPRSLDGYEIIFQELVALGEQGRDSEPILRNFLEHSLELGLCINTTKDDIFVLTEYWESIVKILEDVQEIEYINNALEIRNAKQLGSILKNPSPMLAISPMLSCLLKSWDVLRIHSCTYRVLCCYTHMAFPTRRGIEETAEDRLAFLHAADNFYASGKEASTS